MVFVVSGTWLLTLSTVSAKYVASDQGSSYSALGQLITAERDWLGHGVLDAAIFSLGALLLNAALYRAQLVPRWLSLWGLAGATAYVTAGLLVIYGLEPLSTPQVVLEAPLGLQEIALALWLIVKGFSTRRGAPSVDVGAVAEQRHVRPAHPGRAGRRPKELIPRRATPSTSRKAVTTRQYHDTQVDVKLVLSSLSIAMLFVFAYVDIFALLRSHSGVEGLVRHCTGRDVALVGPSPLPG